MSSRRFDPAGFLFGVGFPALAALLMVVLTAVWRDRLPVRIATHWTGSAQPDGFSAPWANTWLIVAITVLVGGGTGLVAAFARLQLMMRRIMLVTGCLVAGMIATINIVLMAGQLDLVDASEAQLQLWSIGLGTLIGLAVGVLGASLLRDYRVRVPATEPPPADLPRARNLTLPITERIGLGRGASLVTYGLLVVVAIGTCVLAGSWWPAALVLAVALLVAASTRFRLVIDDQGLRVECLGAAVVEYDAAEISAVRAHRVDPFRDFGGWGLRMGPRRHYGLVTRRGPGFTVELASGDKLTVTNQRADELAADLNTLADCQHTSLG